MDQRMKFILEWNEALESKTELCRCYGKFNAASATNGSSATCATAPPDSPIARALRCITLRNSRPSGSPAFSKSALGTRYMARPKFAPYSGANSLNNTLPHRQPSANFFVTKGSPGLGKNAAGHHHTAGLWHTRSSPMTSYRSTARAGSCAAMARASTRSPWSITPAATCSAAKAWMPVISRKSGRCSSRCFGNTGCLARFAATTAHCSRAVPSRV